MPIRTRCACVSVWFQFKNSLRLFISIISRSKPTDISNNFTIDDIFRWTQLIIMNYLQTENCTNSIRPKRTKINILFFSSSFFLAYCRPLVIFLWRHTVLCLCCSMFRRNAYTLYWTLNVEWIRLKDDYIMSDWVLLLVCGNINVHMCGGREKHYCTRGRGKLRRIAWCAQRWTHIAAIIRRVNCRTIINNNLLKIECNRILLIYSNPLNQLRLHPQRLIIFRAATNKSFLPS